MRHLTLAACCATLGVAVVADAQPYSFADGFETGTLVQSDATPGQWDGLDQRPGVELLARAEAAHRGAFGLRVTDTDASPQPGDVGSLYWAPSGAEDNVFLRAWVRVMPSSTSGNTVLLQLLSDMPQQQSLCDVAIMMPGAQVYFSGSDSPGSQSSFLSGVSVSDGAWHLLECGLMNIAANVGLRRVWVDGQQVAEASSPTVQGPRLRVTELQAGQPWAQDNSFTGTIDIDDVRTSGTPPASTLLLSTISGPFSPGQCILLSLHFTDSEGASAAPYEPHVFDPVQGLTPPEVSVHVDVSGQPDDVVFFSDRRCENEGSIALATASTTFSFTARHTVTLTARAADYLPSQALQIVILDDGGVGPSDGGSDVSDGGSDVSDAGSDSSDGGGSPADAGGGQHLDDATPGDATHYTIGCGCGQASAASAAWLALLVGWLASRRGRRGAPVTARAKSW